MDTETSTGKPWECRTKKGRPRLYETGEALWSDACEYFQWVTDNPLIECKPFSYQGVTKLENVPKMRAMTIQGLCIFLGINAESIRGWRSDDILKETVARIEMVIYTQKLEGAAADLLNGGIIARELGLSDKTETTHKVTDDGTNEW